MVFSFECSFLLSLDLHLHNGEMGGLEPWSMEDLNLLKISWFNSDLATVILYLQ